MMYRKRYITNEGIAELQTEYTLYGGEKTALYRIERYDEKPLFLLHEEVLLLLTPDLKYGVII